MKYRMSIKANRVVDEIVSVDDLRDWLRTVVIDFVVAHPNLRSFSIFSSVEDIDTFNQFVPHRDLQFPPHHGIALCAQGRVWYIWVVEPLVECGA